MTREDELHLIVDLLYKHGLPISPVLEYAIEEKLGDDGNLLFHNNEQAVGTNASWTHKMPQDKVFAYTQLIASVRKQYKFEEPQSLSHALPITSPEIRDRFWPVADFFCNWLIFCRKNLVDSKNGSTFVLRFHVIC